MNSLETANQKIDDLITRFFFKEDQLCYRIMVKFTTGTMVAFNEYADYNEYKKAYTQLIEKKRMNESLTAMAAA